MPVYPYDDRKVSLRKPHGNGDLDIVRTSCTRRKANVTEATALSFKNFSTVFCFIFFYIYFSNQFSILYWIQCHRKDISFGALAYFSL